MNNLSWFLYWADVLPTLARSFIPFTVIAIVGAVICSVLGVFMHATQGGYYTMPAKETIAYWEGRRKICAKMAYHLWAVAIVLAIVLSLMPSRNTLYAIAASEVGEKLVQTETVQGLASDATKALQQWIKTQLNLQGAAL